MSSAHELRLGTRGSQLALWQANTVASRLVEAGGPSCRIVVIKTSGDQLQQAPLSEVGGKRLFVKEIEDALLRGEIDLAVHSSKDMPVILPDGLAIGSVLPRENPLDAVVLPAASAKATTATESGFAPSVSRTLSTVGDMMAELGRSPSIGTGSVRRIAQLIRLFPAARFEPIRGNLDTRLRKLDAGGYDALVLAAAGLTRLGFASRIALTLPASACVPAPGQGIVAIEIREADRELRAAVGRVDDALARAALETERAFVAALGGGCQTPVGALALPADGETLELVAAVVALDGSRMVRGQARGSRGEPAGLGTRLATQLLAEGAGEILAEAQQLACRPSST